MTVYLTIDEIIMIHEILIQRFGGSSGLRDRGILESAIFRPQSGYYKDVIEQAAALFESLAVNHPFVDGNKRIAFAAMDTFLRINGYSLSTNSKDAYENIMEMFDLNKLNFETTEKWLRRIVKPA
jgi:death-on-curing protein